MQHQKHQQVKYYNKSFKDLPSLQTGDAVYVQSVPNVRKWVPLTIVEILNARSYRMKNPRAESALEIENLSTIRHSDLSRVSRLPKGHDTK